MDKKEAKIQYLKMQLADPNVEEWEKRQIRQRLGIVDTVSESDFSGKTGDELFGFVYNYIDDQLAALRQKKRINEPFGLLTDKLKTMYYLSLYSAYFESDSLEQLYEYDDSVDEMRSLSQAFRTINLPAEAALIDTFLSKRKIADTDIEQLQAHFWESDTAVHKIDTAIEAFIKGNIQELIGLQNLQ